MTLISVQPGAIRYPSLPFDGSKSIMEFLLDAADDVTDLPTAEYIVGERNYGTPAPGSHAVVIATADEYYLSSESEWTLFGPAPELTSEPELEPTP